MDTKERQLVGLSIGGKEIVGVRGGNIDFGVDPLAVPNTSTIWPAATVEMTFRHRWNAGFALACPHLWLREEIRQVHFPRSKRKRIRKKWAKNPANWEAIPISIEPDPPRADN